MILMFSHLKELDRRFSYPKGKSSVYILAIKKVSYCIIATSLSNETLSSAVILDSPHISLYKKIDYYLLHSYCLIHIL